MAYFISISDLMRQELINIMKATVQMLPSLGGFLEYPSKGDTLPPIFITPSPWDRISVFTTMLRVASGIILDTIVSQ